METTMAYFNQKLYKALRSKLVHYDEKTCRRVVDAVHSALVEALGAENKEVLPESLLVSELLAESIDGLDIGFRIERQLGIKYNKEQLAIAMLFRNPEDKDKPNMFLEQKTVLDLAEEAYLIVAGRE
ncbi:hypothetical protein A3K73_05245 [Candidatus Pacearchaeota archaeon RBG_13_36_9]|nr:MAG: hypothetical protein A3K73_05245 [Candidatus Pacearchaeota archaeon RBG_13_36_9]